MKGVWCTSAAGLRLSSLFQACVPAIEETSAPRRHPDCPAWPQGMDAGAAKYLEENVGNVLAQALSEMAVVQPKDR